MTRITPQINRSGFTIIETLIVLAIAGLILLIVFEAIPVLDRSSRNNQRHQDVNTVLQAVSNWELNNSGNIPSAGAGNFLQSSKLTYYSNSIPNYVNNHSCNVGARPLSGVTVYIDTPSDTQCNDAVNTNLDAVYVYNFRKCSSNQGQDTNAGAGYNNVVALFAYEGGGGNNSSMCQDI